MALDKLDLAGLSDEQHELIKTCLGYFDMLDVVRLSSTSKAVAQLCHSQLAGSKQLARQLLLQAVQDAAGLWDRAERWYEYDFEKSFSHLLQGSAGQSRARDRRNVQQYSRAVPWLLQAAGGGAALLDQSSPDSAATVSALINTPGVPMDLVKLLVSAGLRISYQQLMAAVRSSVRGVQVWVQVQAQQGINTGLPPRAEAICCRQYGWMMPPAVLAAHPPSAAELEDLLLLAIHVCNLSYDDFETVAHLCEEPAAQQLQPEALVQLLHAVLQNYRKPGGDGWDTIIQRHLCGLPAAERVTPEAASSILWAAIPAQCLDVLDDLCSSMPATRQLDAATVGSMLKKAVEADNPYAAITFCCHPAAAQLDRAAVAGLMRAACAVWGVKGWRLTCEQPTIKDLQRVAEEELGHDYECDDDYIHTPVGSSDSDGY